MEPMRIILGIELGIVARSRRGGPLIELVDVDSGLKRTLVARGIAVVEVPFPERLPFNGTGVRDVRNALD